METSEDCLLGLLLRWYSLTLAHNPALGQNTEQRKSSTLESHPQYHSFLQTGPGPPHPQSLSHQGSLRDRDFCKGQNLSETWSAGSEML